MLEHRSKKVISRPAFARRMVHWLLLTLFLLTLSLLIGMMGYRYFEHMPWIDAFLNTAMLLGGMGEIDALHSQGGKLFAAIYAMYSGIFLVVCGGLLFVPVFHRVLHRFHADK